MPYGVDNYRIQLGLPALPEDNVPKDLYDNFFQLHRAIQNLNRGVSEYAGIDAPSSDYWGELLPSDTLMSGNLTRMYPIAGATILRGQAINLYNDAGTLKARLAVATSAATMAHGIANGAAAIGQRFEMNWLRGTLDSVGGLTIGTLYWLSIVAGGVQSTAPVTAGQIQQPIGLALGTTTLLMDIPLSYRQL